MTAPAATGRAFSPYHVFVIAVLTFLQFTVILDFMVLSPLSAQLLNELHITPGEFSFVVSAYAISAGISGFLAAGIADRFDRKKLLLFFYVGFVVGTFLCGIAPNFMFLLFARVVTGIFGGVIGSITFAIVTDLFPMETRGRVMGFLQMAFASSQVLGLPVGLYLAKTWGWHSPFLMIVGLSAIAGVIIFTFLKPIDGHLKLQHDKNPLEHLVHTVSKPTYLKAFGATALLATGGFMLMPFGSAFGVYNLGLTLDQLPFLYMITGISSMLLGPIIGKLSDQAGKYRVFVIGTFIGAITVSVYCNLGTTPFWQVALLNVVLFIGIMSRIITASALMSAIPNAQDRGAFMAINSSIQQISGGIAALIAGRIVSELPSHELVHYDTLGYVVVGAMMITIVLMFYMNRLVNEKMAVSKDTAPAVTQPVAKAS